MSTLSRNNEVKRYPCLLLLIIIQIFLLLYFHPNAFAETRVGGPITGNVTWKASRSPYIVIMHTEVIQGSTLRIEPGVVVKFEGLYFLKVSGTLIAKGTKLRPIVFTSDKKKPGSWIGIQFNKSARSVQVDEKWKYMSGSILEHCKVEYGGHKQAGAVACGNVALLISNCIINDNRVGVSSGRDLTIRNSLLFNNEYAIQTYRSSAIIENNIVKNNLDCAIKINLCDRYFGNGKHLINRVKINCNLITNNKRGGIELFGQSCGYNQGNNIIAHNSIRHNSGDGIYIHGLIGKQVTIKYNEITNNSGSGIRISCKGIIHNCNIFGNREYQIVNVSHDQQATSNWWGTTDELTIRKLIYDHWDNPDKGKVIIKPFLAAPNPNAGVKVAVGPRGSEDYSEATVSNVNFSQTGNTVAITYDLEGTRNRYTISIKCSKDGGNTYSIIPMAVSGDVGKNVRPGKNKKIKWNVLNDWPEGLSGKEFVFKVEIGSLPPRKGRLSAKTERKEDGRFIEKDNEVIIDTKTRLVWQKYGSERKIRWDQIDPYINHLNKIKFAGLTNWKLPSLNELRTLLNPNTGKRYSVFGDTQPFVWCARTKRANWYGFRKHGLGVDGGYRGYYVKAVCLLTYDDLKAYINKRRTILFEEDFSTDKGWISEPKKDIFRDAINKNIAWHARRNRMQYMYHSIPNYTGDFTLRINGIIEKRTNNCWIEMGLTDRAKFTKGAMPGIAIMFGWFGGGTPYHHYYAYVRGQCKDGEKFTSTTGHITPSKDTWAGYIKLSKDTWYHFILAVKGNTWELIVKNSATGAHIGSLSGILKGKLPSLNYVYFANLDKNDWPTMAGRLDNISVSID